MLRRLCCLCSFVAFCALCSLGGGVASSQEGGPRIAAARLGMVAVPGGAFLRGSKPDLDTKDDETPRASVEVSAFWIDTTEVTVSAYGACVEAGVCKAPDTSSELCSNGGQGDLGVWNNWLHRAERGAHPINCVDWSQAAAFCAWVGKRLPTEAEWEKAARGVDGRTYPWGEESASCTYASMKEGGAGCGEDRTLPVGSKPQGASPFGVLDMSGNVAEWVADWYDSYPKTPTSDPQGPRKGSERVTRGGQFNARPTLWLRAAARSGLTPDTRSTSIGFRCARSEKPTP